MTPKLENKSTPLGAYHRINRIAHLKLFYSGYTEFVVQCTS